MFAGALLGRASPDAKRAANARTSGAKRWSGAKAPYRGSEAQPAPPRACAGRLKKNDAQTRSEHKQRTRHQIRPPLSSISIARGVRQHGYVLEALHVARADARCANR